MRPALESRGEQWLRIGYGEAQSFGNITDLKQRMSELKAKVGSGSELIWVNSITPGSMDGANTRNCTALQRTTAMTMLDDYWPRGQCYLDGEYRGAIGKGSPISANYYKDWVLAMGANGIRFGNTHVAGDRTITMMLNLVEQLQEQYGPSSTAGWSFDHCTLVNPSDFQRAARLGVMFSCATKYIENGAGYARTYGEKVAHTFVSPMKSMIEAGIKVVFESDRDTYFWHDMQIMPTRKDPKGDVWGPQEKLDRPTALRVATQWAADYMLRRDKLGTLEVGKWADLIVLDKDYLTIPVEQVETIQPQLTIVGGRIVFVHSGFADEYRLRPEGATVGTYEQLKSRRLYRGPMGAF